MPNVTSAKIVLLDCEVDGSHTVSLAAIQYPFMLVGAAGIEHAESDTPTLVDVYVHPGLRRIGIATELVRAAKNWAEQRDLSLYLHVKPDNQGARQLYEAERFEYTGETTDEGSLWMVSLAHDCQLGEEPTP